MGADCCKNACAPIAIALLPEAQAPSCEEQYLILETLHQVDAMFDALSSVVRRTFLLSQLDGLTYDAIALHLASRYSEPRKVTGYGGVIFDLTPHWSAYASYAEFYKPQALYRSVPMPGDSLKPVTGKSHERGVKGELANGAVTATFSVFHVERNGEASATRRIRPIPSCIRAAATCRKARSPAAGWTWKWAARCCRTGSWRPATPITIPATKVAACPTVRSRPGIYSS